MYMARRSLGRPSWSCRIDGYWQATFGVPGHARVIILFDVLNLDINVGGLDEGKVSISHAQSTMGFEAKPDWTGPGCPPACSMWLPQLATCFLLYRPLCIATTIH